MVLYSVQYSVEIYMVLDIPQSKCARGLDSANLKSTQSWTALIQNVHGVWTVLI